MIIIIIRSLFIISNYFWQPKPLVVAKIYPVLINGICWNRILNTTQSLPEPTKSTSLFTLNSCFNIKINILSGNINSRSKLENMYSSVRPTTRVSARLPILFGKNASVSSLGRGGITGRPGLMEEYSQLPDERGRAGIDPESNICHGSDPGQGCCLASCLLSEPSSHALQSDGWQKVAWTVPGGPVIRWE